MWDAMLAGVQEKPDCCECPAQVCPSSKHVCSLYCPALINSLNSKDDYLILPKNLARKAERAAWCPGYGRKGLQHHCLRARA